MLTAEKYQNPLKIYRRPPRAVKGLRATFQLQPQSVDPKPGLVESAPRQGKRRRAVRGPIAATRSDPKRLSPAWAAFGCRRADALATLGVVKDHNGAVGNQGMNVVFAAILLLVVCSAAQAGERPNILLIVSEDNGPELSCYCDPYVRTPHLDRLA